MDFNNHPLYPWLSQLRRELHAHPELGFEEVWTTQKIKDTLRGLGLESQDLPRRQNRRHLPHRGPARPQDPWPCGRTSTPCPLRN